MISDKSSFLLSQNVNTSKIELLKVAEKLKNNRVFHNKIHPNTNFIGLVSVYIHNVVTSPYEYIRDLSIPLMLKHINLK